MHWSIRPSVRPSVYPFVRLSFHVPVRPSFHPSICPSVRPSICPFIRMSIRMFSVCPSICLSIRASIHLFNSLPFPRSIKPHMIFTSHHITSSCPPRLVIISNTTVLTLIFLIQEFVCNNKFA